LTVLIDTDVAIRFLDGEASVTARLSERGPQIALSIISRVQLENCVYRDPDWASARRAALNIILTRATTIPFAEIELDAYRSIVEAVGCSRLRTTDRMIAATASAHDLTLITMNGGDFRDVPGLKLEIWPSPGPA